MPQKQFHIWIKPPNGEWFDCTTKYAQGHILYEEVLPHHISETYVPSLYWRNVLGRETYVGMEAEGYRIQWRPVADKTWRDRELARISRKNRKDMYELVPKEWEKLVPITDHFVHLSKDRIEGSLDIIAYTQSPEKGEQDVQTQIKAGRYLKKYYPNLSSEEIRYYSEAVQSLATELKITMDSDVAYRVYLNGPNSCMKKDDDYWEGEGYPYEDDDGNTAYHPSIAYFAGDLALAYLGDTNAAHARCIVWPEKKQYGRIYGSEERMKHVLERLGYECVYDKYGKKMFNGARMRLHFIDEDRNTLCWPYVDGYCNYSYRKDMPDVLFVGRKEDQEKGVKWFDIHIENDEGGTASFNDPTAIRCALTGKIINEGAQTATLEGGQVVLLNAVEESNYHTFFPSRECYVHNANLTRHIHDDGSEVLYYYRDAPSRGNMVQLYDDGEYNGINTFIAAKSTFRDIFGRRIRNGKKRKYFCVEGALLGQREDVYVAELKQLFEYHPQLNPGRWCTEQPLTKEENERAKRYIGDDRTFRRIERIILNEREAKASIEANRRSYYDPMGVAVQCPLQTKTS